MHDIFDRGDARVLPTAAYRGRFRVGVLAALGLLAAAVAGLLGAVALASRPRQGRPFGPVESQGLVPISELWRSRDERLWNGALERYWDFVPPESRDLVLEMEALDPGEVRRMSAREWYDFLLERYFRWKYPARNRYATTTAHLRSYLERGELAELESIKRELFDFDLEDIGKGLRIASRIRGLGPTGASGLLALLFPTSFGTVDRFAVRALRDVAGLPEAEAVARMKENALTVSDGVLLIGIMRRKAAENNELFGGAGRGAAQDREGWTPRKIDRILWSYGR